MSKCKCTEYQKNMIEKFNCTSMKNHIETAEKIDFEYSEYSKGQITEVGWKDPNTNRTIPYWVFKAIQNDPDKSPVPWKFEEIDNTAREIQYEIFSSSFDSRAYKKDSVLYFDMHLNLLTTKIYLNLSSEIIPEKMSLSVYGTELYYDIIPQKTFEQNVWMFEIPLTNFSKIDGPTKCILKYKDNSWFPKNEVTLVKYSWKCLNLLRILGKERGLGFAC